MINWQKILKDLKKQYKSLAAIGYELDIHPKTLQKAARLGCEDMMYRHGVKLLALHLQHCKDDYREDIKMANNRLTDEQREENLERELQEVINLLDVPMNQIEIANSLKIPGLAYKLRCWVSDKRLFVTKRSQCFYYERLRNEVRTNKTRIIRLTDTEHWARTPIKTKVYVSGGTLSGNF